MTTLANRSSRRTLVVVYYVLFLFYPFFDAVLGFAAFVLFLVVSPLVLKLSSLVRAYYNDDPDEREIGLINQAHRLAYGILVPTVVVVMLVNRYGGEPGPGLQTLSRYLVFDHLLTLLPFVILALTLPAAVMLWLEPDPIEEDASTEHTRRLV